MGIELSRDKLATPDLDWTALVCGIRAGDESAVERLNQTLSRGVQFLLARRLGRENAEAAARDLLKRVQKRLSDDQSLRPDDVPRVVCAMIREEAALHRKSRSGKWLFRKPPLGRETADRILAGMSPLERDALRRYYAGEPSGRILERLNLTWDEFGALRSRARCEFGCSNSQKTNVA